VKAIPSFEKSGNTQIFRRYHIQTVKYADDLVLMAREETMLQGMIDKLIEIGSCYGMEMNVKKKKQ